MLENKRAAYGEEIVSALSRQLTAEYGRGFDRRNLFYMIRFAELFPDEEIVNAMRSQLSWTHCRELLSIDDPLKRVFYAELRIERWSTRTLRQNIDRMLFERTAVAKKRPRRPRDVVHSLREWLSGDTVSASGPCRSRLKNPFEGKRIVVLAQRLVEAGVRMVQINLRGWDNASERFPRSEGEAAAVSRSLPERFSGRSFGSWPTR